MDNLIIEDFAKFIDNCTMRRMRSTYNIQYYDSIKIYNDNGTYKRMIDIAESGNEFGLKYDIVTHINTLELDMKKAIYSESRDIKYCAIIENDYFRINGIDFISPIFTSIEYYDENNKIIIHPKVTTRILINQCNIYNRTECIKCHATSDIINDTIIDSCNYEISNHKYVPLCKLYEFYMRRMDRILILNEDDLAQQCKKIKITFVGGSFRSDETKAKINKSDIIVKGINGKRDLIFNDYGCGRSTTAQLKEEASKWKPLPSGDSLKNEMEKRKAKAMEQGVEWL